MAAFPSLCDASLTIFSAELAQPPRKRILTTMTTAANNEKSLDVHPQKNLSVIAANLLLVVDDLKPEWS